MSGCMAFCLGLIASKFNHYYFLLIVSSVLIASCFPSLAHSLWDWETHNIDKIDRWLLFLTGALKSSVHRILGGA